MTVYGNPRTSAVVPDWPSGAHRTVATFRIESHPIRGERATRTTVDPRTGRDSAAKALTYARRMRIVDGDDGRTYIVADNVGYGHLTVWRGDMKYNEEVVYANDPRHAAMLALFEPQPEAVS